MTGIMLSQEDIARREQETFNAQVAEYYKQFAMSAGGYAPAPSALPVNAALQLMGPSPQQQMQMAPVAYGEADESLLAAAKFWGIAGAEAMPKEALIAAINQYRSATRPTIAGAPLAQRLGMAGSIMQAAPLLLALGAGEAITGGVENLPMVGDWLSKAIGADKAEMWLKQMEEGVKADLPEEFMKYGAGGLNMTGAVAGMWYPGVAAWKIASIARPVGFIGGAIGRGAAQGAATGWLLEGGSEHSKAAIIAGGILGGAGEGAIMMAKAYEPALRRAQVRVSKAFGGKHDQATKAATTPIPGEVPVAAPIQAGAPQTAAPQTADDMERMATALEVDVPGSVGLQSGISAEELAGRAAMAQSLRAQAAQKRAAGVLVESDVDGVVGQMNKQALVVESPALPEIASRTVIDDVAVVEAAVASNPAGTSVIRNVDPETVVRELQARLPGVAFRLARRQGTDKIDVLVGDISDAQVSLYERFGVYEGQRVWDSKTKAYYDIEKIGETGSLKLKPVVKELRVQRPEEPQVDYSDAAGWRKAVKGPSGQVYAAESHVEARLAARDGGEVLWNRDAPMGQQNLGTDGYYNGETFITVSETMPKAPVFDVVPARTLNIKDRSRVAPLDQSSPSTEVSEDLYKGFREYVEGRAAQASEAMGGAKIPGWFDESTSVRLPEMLDDFLDALPGLGPRERALLTQDFNQRRINEFRGLAGEADQVAQRIEQELHRVSGESTQTAAQRLDDLAEGKGFTWIPKPNTASGVLRDNQVNPLQGETGMTPPREIEVGDSETAEKLLRGLQRDPPDITPSSPVPAEVARALPTVSHHEPRVVGAPIRQAADEAAAMADDVERMEKAARSDNILEPDDIAVGDGPPGLRMELEALVASGNYGRILSKVNSWHAKYLMPMRARFSMMEHELTEAGVPTARFWSHYEDFSRKLDRAHNEAGPWHDRAAAILVKFGSKNLREGGVAHTWEILDPVERLAYAKKLGMSENEIKALDELDTFFRDQFPEVGDEAVAQIKRYVGQMRSEQANGIYTYGANDARWLAPETQAFMTHAEEVQLQFHSMDMSVLMSHHTNSLMFHKYAAKSLEAANDMAKTISAIPELKPMGDIFLDWTKLVRRGYMPGHDFVLNTFHAVANAFVPMSKGTAAKILAYGMSTTHRSLLGLRPDVLLRDSIQPLLAVPRVGMRVFTVLEKYANGTEQVKREMWERALKYGGVQRGMPQLEAPGVFDQDMYTSARGAAASDITSDPRRKLAVKIGYAMRDFLPKELRNMQGTKFDPLFWYTKLGERNRLITFTAGFEHAEDAIKQFRRAQAAAMEMESAGMKVVGDMPTDVSREITNVMIGKDTKIRTLDNLVDYSSASTFDKPVVRKFKELIASGSDEEAAALIGNELANSTQFRYGVRETPEAFRTYTGRVGMQMGSFTLQSLQYMREIAKNGSTDPTMRAIQIAKATSWLGAVTLSLKLAKETTGWNFDKWQYYNALTFSGSPWVESASKLYEGGRALMTDARGQRLGAGDQMAINDINSTIGDMAGRMNPLAGGMRTMAGINTALDAPDPLEGIGRQIFTGEGGSRVDMQQGIGAWLDQMGAALPPSPVRAAGVSGGTPPSAGPVYGPTGQPGGIVTPSGTRSAGGIAHDIATTGATDPTRVRQSKHGYAVYDSPRTWKDGKTATHRLDVPSGRRPDETWEQYEDRVIGTALVSFPGSAFVADKRIESLIPEAQGPVRALLAKAEADGVKLDLNETKRSQERQELIFKTGRMSLDPRYPATWTLTSNHILGRAVDVRGDSAAYDWLAKNYELFGFTMIDDDPGHISYLGDAKKQAGFPNSNIRRADSASSVPRAPVATHPGSGAIF